MKNLRKAELRKHFIDGQISIFKAGSTRWSDGMANPNYDDVDYFLTYDEAENHVNKIKIDIGYSGFIEKWVTNYDSFNENIEFGQTINLADIINRNSDIEDNWSFDENKGNPLNENGVIVFYNHHRYMNYAYNINFVKFVIDSNLKYESDLIQDADSISATYCKYFASIEDLVEGWEYIGRRDTPFDKLNKGTFVIETFLKENNVEGYFELQEEEENG